MFINKNQMSFFHLPEIYGAGVSSGSGTRMIQIFKFTKIIVSILKEMTWRILKSNLRSPSKFRNNFDWFLENFVARKFLGIESKWRHSWFYL